MQGIHLLLMLSVSVTWLRAAVTEVNDSLVIPTPSQLPSSVGARPNWFLVTPSRVPGPKIPHTAVLMTLLETIAALVQRPYLDHLGNGTFTSLDYGRNSSFVIADNDGKLVTRYALWALEWLLLLLMKSLRQDYPPTQLTMTIREPGSRDEVKVGWLTIKSLENVEPSPEVNGQLQRRASTSSHGNVTSVTIPLSLKDAGLSVDSNTLPKSLSDELLEVHNYPYAGRNMSLYQAVAPVCGLLLHAAPAGSQTIFQGRTGFRSTIDSVVGILAYGNIPRRRPPYLHYGTIAKALVQSMRTYVRSGSSTGYRFLVSLNHIPMLEGLVKFESLSTAEDLTIYNEFLT